MSEGYRTILVYVSDGETGNAALRLASHQAKRFGASLVGVAKLLPIDLPLEAQGIIPPHSDLWNMLQARRTGVLNARRQAFAAAVEAAGLSGRSEFRALEGEGQLAVAKAARYSDLVVVAAARPGELQEYDLEPGDLLLNAGRPVLVQPVGKSVEPDIRRIAVGWDGSREAARAIADAMPFLRRAEKVCAITAGEAAAAEQERVVEYLLAHGVKAEAARATRGARWIADAIMEAAEQHDIQLLVIGAYGHSRFRESLVGGVTREVLERARMPVLMSH